MKQFKSFCAAIVAGTALLLSACGGGGSSNQGAAQTPTQAPAPTFNIGGSITGLGEAGLTLVNGSETLAIGANAKAFNFVNKVAQGATYSVSVGSQPVGFICTLNNASGTVALADVQTVAVNCVPIPFAANAMVSTLVQGAPVNAPGAVATDVAGNIYVADTSSCAILKITPAGIATILAGGGGCVDPVDGIGAAAKFNFPLYVAVDPAGNVFVAEYNNNIRKITPGGVVTTLYGKGESGLVDTAGVPVQAFVATGMAVDGTGNLYFSVYQQNYILKITPGGVVTTLAGNVSAGFADGIGSAARFSSPHGVALDSSGNLYVADGNDTIRKVSPQGQVTTLLPKSSLSGLFALAIDPAGNLYAAGNKHSVRFTVGSGVPFGGVLYIITSAGVVTRVGGDSGAQYGPVVNGPSAVAQFSNIQGIAVDGAGNIYAADLNNIRKITQ